VPFLPAGYSLVEVVPLGGAPGSYSYAVPPLLAGKAILGRRVIVPFGTRRRAGIVLGPTEVQPEGTLRELESVLDEGPLLSAEVLELTRWAAQYYGMPLSVALRAALPPDSEAEDRRHPILSAAGREALSSGQLSASDRKALRAVESSEAQVLKPGTLKRLAAQGLVGFQGDLQTGGEAPLIEIVVRQPGAEPPVIADNHKSLKAVWAAFGPELRVPMSALQERVAGAREAVKRLVKRGLVTIEEVPLTASFLAKPADTTLPTLSEEQAAALQRLEAALTEVEPKPFLLQGVTGSGKTEVYLRLIAKTRQQGHSAIVLVPEIALTPQLAGRFRARFGSDVAVLHSGLTDRDRAAEWHRIRRGEADIVVGARSAIFAPVVKPRVIIVDEEHDSSFKQGEGLRYHGRDLAVVRGRLAGAVVVLGSATPALESMFNADSGRYERLRLTRRIDSRPMPRIEPIDLRGREKVRVDGAVQPSGLLSPEMVKALRETVARKEQAIVFLNRRGHSTSLICRDCGAGCRCEQCSVAFTWHERQRRLVCHYCGTREEAPDVCRKCGSVRLLYAGAGTEKLEDEINAAAPGARVGRLDRDTASTSTKLEAVLDRFSREEIDVLVGTQMVAKGHDFPGVTLVCVLLADAGLHQPDFRASERTAQLLTQVAGRAGRGLKPGRVLIQTYAPETAAVQAVLTHDYDAFCRHELADRAVAEYPPFRRLCLIRVEGENDAEAGTTAARCARALVKLGGTELAILGPAPSPLSRLRNKYRFQVLLKATRPAVLRAAINQLRETIGRPPAGVRITIDVDPVDML
jgi:primosomal protein N' (replication factor Y)